MPVPEPLSLLLDRGPKFIPCPCTSVQINSLRSTLSLLPSRLLNIASQSGSFTSSSNSGPSSLFFRKLFKARVRASQSSSFDEENPLSASLREMCSLRSVSFRTNVPLQSWLSFQRLRRDAGFICKMTDKGGGLVVMRRSFYLYLSARHLSDESTYRIVDTDLVVSSLLDQISKIRNLSDRWKSYSIKEQDEVKKRLLQTLSSCLLSSLPSPDTSLLSYVPLFYVLPKLHKNPIDVRPIFAAHSVPVIAGLKMIDAILNPILQKEPTILIGSLDFINRVESTVLPSSFCRRLVVGDVKQLYLCIDIQKALLSAIFFAKLHAPSLVSSVPFFSLSSWPNELSSLIRACHLCSFCRFHDLLFQQVYGLGMGLADAVVLANLFMVSIEKEWLEKAKTFDISVELYGRLVDDVFMCVSAPSDDVLKTWLDSISVYDRIKVSWTVSSSSVDFLDLTVYFGPRYEQEKRLDLRLYRKSCALQCYTHPSSCHPHSQLTSWIKGEMIRFVRSCTSFSEFMSIKRAFFSQLLARGYNANLCISIMNSVSWKDRITWLRPVISRPRPYGFIVPVPFHPLIVSLRLASNLDKIVSRFSRIARQYADYTLFQYCENLSDVCFLWTVLPSLRNLLVRASD